MRTMTCLTCGSILALAWGLASPALGSFFDVIGSGLTAGPPYPSTPPILVRVTDDNDPPRTAHIEDILFTFAIPEIPDFPGDAIVRDSGGGEGSPGTTLSTEYYQLSSEPPLTIHIESFFDIFAPDGLTAVVMPGPATYADSFFDVFFDVQFSDGWMMKHHLHGEIPLGQDLMFTSVGGVMVDARPGRTIVSYDASGSSHGRPDALLPLMTVELTGSYVPEPSTLMLAALSALVILRRGRRTEISTSRVDTGRVGPWRILKVSRHAVGTSASSRSFCVLLARFTSNCKGDVR